MLNSIDILLLLFVSMAKSLVSHQCKQGFVLEISLQQEVAEQNFETVGLILIKSGLAMELKNS